MSDATGGGRIFVNGEDLGQKIDRVSRGGPKTHPQTLEQARVLLGPQLDTVRASLAAIPENLRAKRVVIEAEVWANYLANSYFPAALVRQMRARPLGSRSIAGGTYRTPSAGDTVSPTKSYLIAVDQDALNVMEAILRDAYSGPGANQAKEQVRQFNSLRIAPTHTTAPYEGWVEEQDESGLLPFEAVLHPDPDASTLIERAAASEETVAKFAALIGRNGGHIHAELNDVVDGLTFIAVDLPPAAVEDVAAFNPLRSLTPAPSLELFESEAAPEDVLHAPTAGAPDLPHVVIFDGGVRDTGVFRDLVTHVDLTTRGLANGDVDHGSAVTAAVVFGELTPGEPAPAATARATHYQVVRGPDARAREYPWILSQIAEIVERDRPPIVNLSLGPRIPTDDHEPNRWTAVLDKLAHEHGTLFVTAAGNDGMRDRALGFHRVQVPGDMVNGLCVGAFVHNTPGWEVAPYSGRGPGRAGARIQPAVVAFGGGEVSDRFARMRPDGQVVQDRHGTSFATPLVTNLAARLSRELGTRSDAPTLRALIVHSASRPDEHDILDVGHGRVAQTVEDVLECARNEVTAIYQGVIARDEVMSFALPHPAAGTRSGTYNLRWTLAFATGTDSAEAGDYTNAGLELKFRPHADKFSFTRGNESRTADVVREPEKAAQLIAAGHRPSRYPKSAAATSTYAPEGVLREMGKWESIQRWTATKQGRSLLRPTIDISHVTREGGQITTGTDDIEFSLIVTIATRADLDLYSRAQAEFSALTPLPVRVDATVQAETQVQLDV